MIPNAVIGIYACNIGSEVGSTTRAAKPSSREMNCCRRWVHCSVCLLTHVLVDLLYVNVYRPQSKSYGAIHAMLQTSSLIASPQFIQNVPRPPSPQCKNTQPGFSIGVVV